MTFRGVNKERLEWLLNAALSPEELRRFFKERREPLIMKGDKQNAPRSHDEAVARVLRFTDGAQQVLGDWLRTRLKSESAVEAAQLLPHFRAIEELGLKMKAPAIQGLAYSGLLELYSKEPDTAFLAFLSTEIGSRGDRTAPDREPEGPLFDDVGQFAMWAVGLRDGASVENETLRFAAQLADAARGGDTTTIDGRISDATRAQLMAAHAQAAPIPKALANVGIEAIIPKLVAPDLQDDYCRYDVLAVPFGSPVQGTWFLDVVALVGPDGPLTMSHDDLRRVFPDEGRVILHPDTGLPAPKAGVCESYRVAHFKTPRRIKVKVVGAGTRVTPVVYVPHKSEERDLVREWILKHRDTLSGHTIFVLSDGLCVRARDTSGFGLTNAFEWTFDAWDVLRGVELPQGPCVLGMPPPPSQQYECTPPGVLARRALKLLSDRRDFKLTKAQLSELMTALSDVNLSMPDVHRQRIVNGLQTLSSTDETFGEFVSILLTSPDVKRELDKQKALAAEAAQRELAKERETLENLRRDAEAMRKRLERLAEEEAEQSRQIKLSVRKAFETARERGVETLGQLAVWQELLGHGGATRDPQTAAQPAVLHINNTPPLASEILPATAESVASVFEMYGFTSEEAHHLAESIAIGTALGLPIIIEGPGASYVSTRVAAALAKSCVQCIDVPVGLLSTSRVLSEALGAHDRDVILLRSANLSDMSSYAAPLLLRIAEVCARPPLTRPEKVVIASGTSGPAALQWPQEFSELSLRIDLGVDGHHKRSGHVPPLNRSSPLRRKAWARIERAVENAKNPPSNLIDSVTWLFFGGRDDVDTADAN